MMVDGKSLNLIYHPFQMLALKLAWPICIEFVT